MRTRSFLSVAAALLIVCAAAPASAQTSEPVRNPRAVAFTSADHDRVDRYEIDVVAPDGTVLQTITVLRAETTVEGAEVVVRLNIQPIAWGAYTFVARAVAGTLRSENSVPSPVWERGPMQLGQPQPRRE